MDDQLITDKYAIYLDDCLEVMPRLPDGSVHLSILFATICKDCTITAAVAVT